ncbi:MAG: L-histidine N(alpha)-methyltransferase [Desulfobacteraceae bacterium]|nr:MAG: L-histidine N(alpha)-methyltransferase [Desulfobacteraceae bacterium]
MKPIAGKQHRLQSYSPAEQWAEPRGQVQDLSWGARQRLSFANYVRADFKDEIGKDVREGLSARPKTLPCKYFYDDLGSRLFDQICRLPEYYPTRTEISILRTSGAAIMSFFEPQPGDLVEIGCGADLKIRQLFERTDPDRLAHIRYVPMDISAGCLVQSARRMLADFRGLKVHALIADFTRHVERIPAGRKMIVFFGGTFGNFTFAEGIDLLKRLAGIMGPEDRLVIGLDMIKEKEILEAAYNDRQGVTAAFNLNLLQHINVRLRADFDLNAFEHLAFWNERQERIEMHLQAKKDFNVNLAELGISWSFTRGESIRTEISQKFSRKSAQERFRKAGLQAIAWHTDPAGWFCLVELRRLQALDLGYAIQPSGNGCEKVVPSGA